MNNNEDAYDVPDGKAYNLEIKCRIDPETILNIPKQNGQFTK